MRYKTFMDAVEAGAATAADIDDWIESWHCSDSDASLDDFLGLTPEEGALFASAPESIEWIVTARLLLLNPFTDEELHRMRTHTRSVRARLAAMALLLIVQIFLLLRSDGPSDPAWWLGMACPLVATLFYFGLKRDMDEHLEWLKRLLNRR